MVLGKHEILVSLFVKDFKDFKGLIVLEKHEILDSHFVRDFRD